MAKYIDAEKLKKSIGNYVEGARAALNPIDGDADYYKGKIDACKDMQEVIASLQQEHPKPTCKTCGFYENNCPFIRGKLIPYPNRVCKDYTYSVMKEQEQPEVDLKKEIARFVLNGGTGDNTPTIGETARHFYELGFNEKSDAPKIKGWVARDKSGDLYFFHYDCKPHRTDGVFYSECSEDVFHLDNSMFSEIDWQTEPIEVELTISRVKTE